MCSKLDVDGKTSRGYNGGSSAERLSYTRCNKCFVIPTNWCY